MADYKAYPATFGGITQALIQDAFHFDTNQFLVTVDGERAPLDYDDLFSVLSQPGPHGSWGSSGDDTLAMPSADSGGSPAPAQTISQPHQKSQEQQQRQQQPELKQAKNSRDAASKRARDGINGKSKQHQVKELEALAAKKNEDLQRLERENCELKFRSKILEKVIQVRDHQLKVMRGVAEDLPQYWGTRPAPGGPPPPPSPWDAAAAATHGSIGLSNAAAVRAAGLACCVCPGVPLSAADRERFRSLQRGQLMAGWKHFLTEVAVPLLALESNSEDEQAATCVRQLAAEGSHLLKHASLLAPDTVMVVMQTHLETEVLTAAEQSHWRTVVRALELSPEQVRELRAVFRLFTGIMAAILLERKAINQRLAEGVHGGVSSVAEIQAAVEQLTVSAECEVLQRLQRCMRREKSAHLLLRGFLFGRTLSVLQFVKAAVYSYPWIPDATAIVATVVEVDAGGSYLEEGGGGGGGGGSVKGSDGPCQGRSGGGDGSVV